MSAHVGVGLFVTEVHTELSLTELLALTWLLISAHPPEIPLIEAVWPCA